MLRPYLVISPAICLAISWSAFGPSSSLAQTNTASVATSTALSLQITHQLALESLEARLQSTHQDKREKEALARAKVESLSRKGGRSLSASTAVQLFSESGHLLASRIADLKIAIQVSRDDVSPTRILRRRFSESRFQAQWQDIDAHERAFAHKILLGRYRDVHSLVDARAVLLGFLPSHKRGELLSWSPQSQAQLALEAETVMAMTQAHGLRVRYRFGQLSSWWTDMGGLRQMGSLAFSLLCALLAWIWLRRQVPHVLSKLRQYEYHEASTVKRLRQIEKLLGFISDFGLITINILAIHLFAYVLDGRLNYIEIKVAFAISFWLVYYRFAQRIAELLIYRIARRRFNVSPQTRQDISESIFFAGRIILGGGLLLSIIHAVTNFGLIYFWSRKLVLFAMLLAAFALLNRWRPSITAIYLENRPKGALSNWVEKAKDKHYGFILVCFAFVYLAAQGLMVILRDTVLSFEQSRKALAFLFRRRLEKHAEELGHWEGQIDKLPETLRAAFTLEPLLDSSLRVDHFPGLDEFQAQYQRWLNYKTKGALLLLGPLGFGKSTWLHRAVEAADLEHAWIDVCRKDQDDATLASHLSAIYNTEAKTHEDLVEVILNGPRQVLVLDDCHQLVTRSIGGCTIFEDLMRLIEATGHHVFWLCAMDSLTWKFITSARAQRPWFRAVVTLRPWSDEAITQLIMARAVRSGVAHCFNDLVTEDQEDKSSRRLAEVSESYTGLIWDSSDGCPWVAVHYWLRSLVPVNEKQVRVRLFRHQNLTRLEQWPKEAVFLYAALALHNRLSVSEIARILRYPISLCESFLNQGCEEGYLLCDSSGRYHLNVSWYRPIVRYLRQRHAVEDA